MSVAAGAKILQAGADRKPEEGLEALLKFHHK